jgi:GDP-L-fucose synthase
MKRINMDATMSMPEKFALHGKRIWVAGHSGLVGSALVRRLESEDCAVLMVNHKDLDLRRQAEVESWMASHQPDVIILAAARVGGIAANEKYPADFLYDNLAITQNVVHQAYLQKVQKLVFLGSSCIYPKHAPQPISEDALMTGPFEPTNEAYAIAKIAGLKLCQSYRAQYGCNFISLMPCNLYGPGDHWDEYESHVIPGLITRFHNAKEQGLPYVSLWGSGTPLREFLYSDDLAEAILIALETYSDFAPLNIGSGEEMTISNLASIIARVVGYEGKIICDPSKPDGAPRKVLESSRIRELGWYPHTPLVQGLKKSYADFLSADRVVSVGKVRGAL